MRIGLATMGDGPIRPAAAAMERLAAAAGTRAGHLWIAEAYLFRDALVQASTALASSTRARVATGVVNVYARHPALLGMAAATLLEEYGERFVLGLGPGSSAWMRALGYQTDRAFSDVAATLRFLRRLFGGEEAVLNASWIKSDPVRLPRQLARPVDIVLAGGGPRMLRLASEEADGVLLPFIAQDADETAAVVESIREWRRGGAPAVGCARQCFAVGAWMGAEGHREITRLAAALAGHAGPAPPEVFDLLGIDDVKAHVERLAETGLDELAFVVTQSSATDVTSVLAEALADGG